MGERSFRERYRAGGENCFLVLKKRKHPSFPAFRMSFFFEKKDIRNEKGGGFKRKKQCFAY